MTHHVTLVPRDPMVARDGRPFGISQRRMRSLEWPYPSVVAGSLRTAVGKCVDPAFPRNLVDELKKLAVGGPFPVSDARMFLPSPADIIADENGKCFRLRPIAGGEAQATGTDVPAPLAPVLPVELPAGFRYGHVPAWWSVERLTTWLVDAKSANLLTDDSHFRQPPAIDTRTHVRIDPQRLAAEEGMLFYTSSLVFDHRSSHDDRLQETELCLRVDGNDRLDGVFNGMRMVHPVGGERRLAHWEATPHTADFWKCPKEIKAALANAKRVRMLLSSAAAFDHGWRPGWLDRNLIGTPPWLQSQGISLPLKLVGVANYRWRAVSGFSLEHGRRGPKALQRLVPSGSVYFFELADAKDATPLADAWLRSVSDDLTYQRDGFGLAVWGVW